MRMYEIISKKKRGEILSAEEIEFFVKGYTDSNIPDYQASALLMAICLCGMNDTETQILTDAIARSGDSVDLSVFGDLSADKHSTGGVGDKTTLIVAPLAAACGLKVAKMSGRGLGHTGGTIDKLESFPGYSTTLSPEDFIEQVRNIGVAVIAQTGNLAPADKKLYALRDVTATVDSIPLITSSIMGKKLAAGARNIVLDVKCGSGAFVKTPEDAELLAESMVKIGKLCGRNTTAVITDMDTPLGSAIGNILEIKEAIDVLRGSGPRDLFEISVRLATEMVASTLAVSTDDAEALVKYTLTSGKAFEKLKEWIGAQGGDTSLLDAPELFPEARYKHEVIAEKDGCIAKTDAEIIGTAAMKLGAGRSKKDDEIDYTAGIFLCKKTGDRIKKGDTLATLYTNREDMIEEAQTLFLSSVTISDDQTLRNPLIYKIVK